MTVPPLLLLFLSAQPFWEARPAAAWTDAELKIMLSESPWAQGVGPSPQVEAILATAAPVVEAETELVRRLGAGRRPQPDPDYTDYLREHRTDHFVLAIPYTDLTRLGSAVDQRRLEEESVMRVGRRRIAMAGHFPPTPSDPVLRLIFPRAVTAADKSVAFELYLPGVSQPARLVEFRVKDLMYRGKLEM